MEWIRIQQVLFTSGPAAVVWLVYSLVAIFIIINPRVGPVHPSFPLVHLLPYFLPFLLLLFFHWLYLFSSFVHPFPFYRNSPTPFPGRRS